MNTIIAKLLAAQKEFPAIAKNRTANIGGKFSYKYADLGDIIAAALPVLHKHGLVLSQVGVVIDGKQALRTVIGDGESEIQSDLLLPESKDPQDTGAILTYFRRYSLTSILGIVADEDTDGPPKGDQRPAQKQPESAANAPQSTNGFKGYGDTVAKEAKPVTEAQLKRLFAIQNKSGINDALCKEIATSLGITCSRKDLNRAQYDKLCAALEAYNSN